jgi:hypothetical protein
MHNKIITITERDDADLVEFYAGLFDEAGE